MYHLLKHIKSLYYTLIKDYPYFLYYYCVIVYTKARDTRMSSFPHMTHTHGVSAARLPISLPVRTQFVFRQNVFIYKYNFLQI